MSVKVFIALFGLVAIANASQLLESIAEKEKSAAALNQYLTLNCGDELAENLEKASKAAAEQPELKPAADALEQLVNVNGKCDSNARDALRAFASLKFAPYRLERVVSDLAEKIAPDTCIDSLEQEFRTQVQFDDPRVSALVQHYKGEVNANLNLRLFSHRDAYEKFLSAMDHSSKSHQLVIGDIRKQISNDVVALSKDDPKAQIYEYVTSDDGQRKPVFHPENFKYAFETYLLRPCQELTQKTERLFEGVYGVTKYIKSPSKSDRFRNQLEHKSYRLGAGRGSAVGEYAVMEAFMHFMSADFKDGLMAYKRCRVIEALTEEQVNSAFSTADLRD